MFRIHKPFPSHEDGSHTCEVHPYVMGRTHVYEIQCIFPTCKMYSPNNCEIVKQGEDNTILRWKLNHI